jgi:hypothetical protein
MTYNATYETSDLSSMFVDLIGNGLFQVIAFVGLIVLIFLIGWIVKLSKKVVKG